MASKLVKYDKELVWHKAALIVPPLAAVWAFSHPQSEISGSAPRGPLGAEPEIWDFSVKTAHRVVMVDAMIHEQFAFWNLSYFWSFPDVSSQKSVVFTKFQKLLSTFTFNLGA